MNTKTKLSLAVIAALASAASCATELPSLQSKPDAVIMTQTDNSLTIISDQMNNVMKWNTFSVSEDARVFFDSKNYLNLVTGGRPSVINGEVFGYGNLYIVNPAGITAGVNSVISAPKLGLSTAPIGDDAIEVFSSKGVLPASAADGIGRVNLLGSIQANNLSVEGGQIVIRDISSIRTREDILLTNRNSEAFKLKSSMHRIDIGGPASTDIERDYGLGEGEHTSHLGQTPISTASELQGIGSEGDYFITNDIDLGTITSPLAGGQEFKGSLDGTFSTVSFALEDPRSAQEVQSGLFATTANATFRNLRVEGSVKSSGGAGSSAGVIAGFVRGGAFESVEIRNSSVSFTRDAANRAAGGIAGIMTEGVLLKDSSVVADSSIKDLAASGMADVGAITGRNLGSIKASGLSFAALSEGSALDAVGMNSGSLSLPASMDEAFAALGDVAKAQFANEDGTWTDLRFHDVFEVRNLTLDEDAGAPDYGSLIRSEAFEPSSWFTISLESTPVESGAYAFSLTPKRSNLRSLMFRNTDKDGGRSLSSSGLALAFVPKAAPEPDPSEPTTPATPDPKPAEPADPAVPSDPSDGGSSGQGGGFNDAGGSGTADPGSASGGSSGNSSSGSLPQRGSGSASGDEGGYIEIGNFAFEECSEGSLCQVITAEVKFSEYMKKREKMHTMRLRVPSLPHDLLASARATTQRAIAGLFGPGVNPDPLAGGSKKAAV